MRKIRIDFCDFWPDFRKDDNFIWNALKTKFDVELHDHPDFIIYSNRDGGFHKLHSCARIYFGVESYLPDWKECDYALTCHYLDDQRHLRLPYYAIYEAYAGDLIKGNEDAEAILRKKSNFCAFVVSNHNAKARKRVEFFQHLNRRKKVDSGGRAFNNLGRAIGEGPHGKLAFLRPYKFNIAFENSALPGYTTEKIFEAMRARCVPIYWGNPRIHEEFNPKSFLNYSDYPSEEALIERILELDRDDAKYLEVMRQPYFHGDRLNEYFQTGRLLEFFERVFCGKIRPVACRKKYFRLGRWILVKKNRPLSAT